MQPCCALPGAKRLAARRARHPRTAARSPSSRAPARRDVPSASIANRTVTGGALIASPAQLVPRPPNRLPRHRRAVQRISPGSTGPDPRGAPVFSSDDGGRAFEATRLRRREGSACPTGRVTGRCGGNRIIETHSTTRGRQLRAGPAQGEGLVHKRKGKGRHRHRHRPSPRKAISPFRKRRSARTPPSHPRSRRPRHLTCEKFGWI